MKNVLEAIKRFLCRIFKWFCKADEVTAATNLNQQFIKHVK